MTIEILLVIIAGITVMPTMAYLAGDLYNIVRKDFGMSHWFETKKKGDLL